MLVGGRINPCTVTKRTDTGAIEMHDEAMHTRIERI